MSQRPGRPQVLRGVLFSGRERQVGPLFPRHTRPRLKGKALPTGPRRLCFTAVLLLSLAACTAQSPEGSVQFAASIPQALSASDVTRVQVTVSASGMDSLSVELAQSNGSWGGLIGNIPAGPDRSFAAQAFDASGTLRFQGQTSGVTLSANQTTAVALMLQEVSSPPPYTNEAPLIDSLVASSTSVLTGGSLTLTATAHDPNPGDTLTLAWTASSGTFSDFTSATPSWTAPASAGIQTLTLTVTDSQGAAVSISLAINVISGASTGNAALNISFNLWPVVSKVSASLNRLDAGQTTVVSALASDADGDGLSYQWAASCPGTWTNATSRDASFVPSSVPAGACNNCRLTVTVQDGRGGQTEGSLSLCVTTPSAERFPPLFTHFYQSALSTTPGQTVAFEVTALDPQASALTFAWTANVGSLATAQDTASTSRVVWTAPSAVEADITPTLTAVVTNAHGLSASTSFSVSGLPTTYPSGTLTSGGLTWLKPRAVPSTWVDAQAYCANMAIAGQTSWRLPTAQELLALGIEKGAPFFAEQGWPLDWLWTLNPILSGHVVVHMSPPRESWGNMAITSQFFVTCVRGTGEFPATFSHAGMTWTRADAVERTYAMAEAYCANTAISGQMGWRLPSESELGALHTAKGSNFLARAGWTLEWVWTSTPHASGHKVMRDGGTLSWGDGTSLLPMTCVYPGVLLASSPAH
ncbi:DUF1566 domain-containing protein [Stigmatella sp. ncwal1]|uniref:DUF1566 domain-containing protein n=1 Tax=Stigmatella ashevillensis TaxID=2995309 RepID=A0ABT5DGK0_9BACT|nr:DUF1566 domain-containing protein [Stigmatella ashevillena]MDC0712194.1 DUF1566 domain-containing protein [Stigmatella ashevillena]